MADLVATRTLVKSPPELWQELSDVDGLTRHLGEFGELKISRLDPEKAIAWEAERANGTVEIEASSWGTKVVLTADLPSPSAPERPEPRTDAAAEARQGGGFFSRWLFRERRWRPAPEPEPVEAVPAEPEKPGPEPLDVQRALALLEEALDTLGSAHHRPFSRG